MGPPARAGVHVHRRHRRSRRASQADGRGRKVTMPDRTVQCVVVTPERAVLDEAVDFVALPMYDGELGVLPKRAPLIGRLGYGELRTKKGEITQRFFIDGGFAQVRADVVTVLTAQAIPAEEI